MVIELVQLTSGSHHANILTALHQLRLQGQLSDVTVQIDHRGDTQEFQAHQVMLAASSGYFKQILLSPDAARDKLLLSNMNASDFSKFLEFVYTGKVEVARDSIGDLQALAQLLVCDDLAQVCSEALSAGIVPNLPNQTAGSESVGGGGLHDVKRESKAKEKRRLQISPTRRELSPPQDAEQEAVAKRTRGSDASDKRQGRRTKLRLAARKVLPRRLHAKKEAPVNDGEALGDDAVEHEDTAEAEAQPENEEGSLPGKLAWGVDDLGGENECQGDDPEELPSTLEGEKEEQDQEEQGDGEEEQPKETKKTSKAQFQCNKCQRTFRYERSFLKHISMYHGVKADVVYRCETCSQTFANRSNLKIHEKHVHSSEREFSCSFCLKTFKRKKDVVRHQRQVHERNLQQVCPICGKALSSKTALLLHERTHTGLKPYECPDCLARFTQNSALKMHRRTHTGEKPYACDECDARFTQKHMLSYHKRSHSGERPFMCEACGKSFASKEYLRHHSNIHTGSKPYKCERCGRGFAQRNSLIQHLKIHTGERPYSCKECDKQFTQLNALQRHQRIHTGEKPYMCSLCKRTFTDMSTLRRHTMIHDSDAPWKTYLVVLEGNMEEKKDKSLGKGKSEKAGHAEKKSAGKKAASAAADTPSKPETPSIQVPAEQVALPTDWASHGAITLVSHGTLGGITVIHTEVHPGSQLQPIVTTDGTGASVISLDGSSIPFSIPVSLAHPVSVSSEVPSTSLSAPAVSVPVSTCMLTPDSGIPTVSTSSVLETAASQTILAPASESDDTLSPDIETVIVGDSVSCKVQKQTGDECEAGPVEQHDPNPPAV